jgi:D-lactate dehydrogenase (cytochrome)
MIIKRDKDFIKCYFEDQSGLLGGNADEAILPENQEEAVEILRDYGSKHVSVTFSGGGTGVTGGRVPFSGAILATDSLNKIINIDRQKRIATLEPGVRLSELQQELSKDGLVYLPEPTESNAFLGGTISTNASGAKGFKYGSTRGHIKRIKLALSTGDTLDLERGKIFIKKGAVFSLPLKSGDLKINIPSYSIPDIKNAAGYYVKDNMDLLDLFIGQEGTLGLVLEADVILGKKPERILSFFSFFNTEKDALDFAREARSKNALSIEYMDSNALGLLRAKHQNIPSGPAAMIYFEQDCEKTDETALTDMWMGLLEKYKALIDKTYFADSEKERGKLLEFRHALPEAVNEIVKRNKLPTVGTDIAVPSKAFREMFAFYREKLAASDIDSLIFGHIGECHMHVNMLPKNEEEFIACRSIYMDFVKKAVGLGGTVSAEHGIGKIKHAYLEAMYGKKNIKQMADLKKSLDPSCILGLDNIFPKDLLKIS